MKTHEVETMIRTMSENSDLLKVLEEFKITPLKAMAALKTLRARRQRRAFRNLARIHCDLIAKRFGPFAVQKLAQLLNEEKPELRLKGAMLALAAGKLDGSKRPVAKPKTQSDDETPTEIESEHARELLLAATEVMRRRRAEERLRDAGVCDSPDKS